jgi:hypothetical protein
MKFAAVRFLTKSMDTTEITAESSSSRVMQIQFECNDDGFCATRSSIFPSHRRLVLFAVLLPAAMAGTNQLLFLNLQSFPWLRLCLYPWMAFSAAVLSWCVGRYLDPHWLRGLVFGWSLALLDILTMAACLSGPIPSEIGYALVAAQISFITVCAVLGPWGWQWRLPALLIAGAAVISFAGSFMNRWNARSWNVLMALIAVVVVLLCIGLRLRRFTLLGQVAGASSSHALHDLQTHQFGLKHMLLWATAVVPMLLVVRGLDLFVVKILGQGGAFSGVLLAMCIATVNLVAIWAVLGGGLWFVRLMTVLLVPFLIAAGLALYSARVETQYGRWNGPPIVDMLIEMRRLWVSWIWLDAALLAALLLFLRASGYRLVRPAPKISASTHNF